MTFMHLLLSAASVNLFFPIFREACVEASLTSLLFLSVSLKVQENVFVEFNHQELLEFYNKVCLILVLHLYLVCCLQYVTCDPARQTQPEESLFIV